MINKDFIFNMKKNVRCIVTRGKLQESEHLIHCLVINENEKIIFKSGNINTPYCLRSTLKPFQCAASLHLKTDEKFKFTNKEVAITCASHHGEIKHIKTIKSILHKLNLNASDLECGFHFPLNKKNKTRLYANKLKKTNIYNNCSGKHAGLLALIINMGLNTKNYIDHKHPIHKYINDYIQNHANQKANCFSTDGCSLPTPFYSLRVLAKLYMKLMVSEKKSILYKVKTSMMQYPEMISGKKGFDTFFMNQFPYKAISKGGAEGMQALALHTKKYGNISLALKVSDGNHRGNYISCIKILKYIDAINQNDEKSLLNFINEKQTNLNNIEIGNLICEISN